MGLALLITASALVMSTAQAQVPTNAYDYVRTSSFGYDATTGQLTSETIEPDSGASCVQTTYQYDDYGNRKSATQSNCASASGNAVFLTTSSSTIYAAHTALLPNGSNVSVPAGLAPTRSANALDHAETRTFDPRFGTPRFITGPNNLTTVFEHDDFGRPITERRADLTRTVTCYCILASSGLDTSSNTAGCGTPATGEAPPQAVQFIERQQQNTAQAAMCAPVRTYIDRLGRSIRTVTLGFDGATQPGGGSRTIAQDVVYNAFGAKVSETGAYFLATGSSTTGSGGRAMSRTDFDVLGRPVAVYAANPQGSQSAVSFAGFGNTQTTARASRTTTSYSGLNSTVVNDLGHSRTEEKNIAGRTVRATDPLGAQVAYQHDAFGSLVATRDPMGNVTTMQVDLRGNKRQIKDPDAGQIDTDYSALGQLKSQVNAKQRAAGQSTTFTYDVLGRLKTRTEPEYTTTWTYDAYADAAACTAGKGKLCEVTTSQGTTRRYSYDSLGRPAGQSLVVAGTPGTLLASVDYDSSTGRLNGRTYPTGLRVAYGYTASGFLETLVLGTAATVSPLPTTAGGAPGAAIALPVNHVLWRAQAVDAAGRIEQALRGNGVTSRSSVEGTTAQVLSISAGAGSASNVVNLSGYAWDGIGRLTQRIDNLGDGSSGAVTETSEPDALGRLQRYTISRAGGPARTVDVVFNPLGNVLSKSDVGVYTYPASGPNSTRPHAVQSVAGAGSVEYGYDANGNVITASAGQYSSISYTSFNLPDGSSGVLGAGGAPATRGPTTRTTAG